MPMINYQNVCCKLGFTEAFHKPQYSIRIEQIFIEVECGRIFCDMRIKLYI